MTFKSRRSRFAAAFAVAAVSGLAFGRSAVAQFSFPVFNVPSPFTNGTATSTTWRNLNLFTLAGVGVPDDGTYLSATVTFNWNSVGGVTPLTSSSNAWSSEARMTLANVPALANTNTTPSYAAGGSVVYSGNTVRSPTSGSASSAANTTLTFTIPFTNTYTVSGGVVPPIYMNYRQSFNPPASQTITWTGVTVSLTRANPTPTTLATHTTAGGFSQHALTANGANWYRLDHTGGNLVIDTYGSSITGSDTTLALYNSGGIVIASNDNNAGDNAITLESPLSRIGQTNLAAGTYYIGVAGSSRGFDTSFSVTGTSTRTGTTRLNINSPFTPTPTIPSTVGTIALGSPGTGALAGGDTAWFRLSYPGGAVFVDTVGSGVADTELAVYDTAGNLVAYNDNIATSNTYSRTALSNLTVGDYYVAVGAQNSVFGNGFAVSNRSTTAGSLSLNVSLPAPPPGVIVPAANSSTFAGSVTGTEVDWFSLNWAGGNLTLDTTGSNLAPSNDTEIGLYDVLGNLIESDDDDGPDLLSLISRTNLAAGTYYIAVTGYNATFGSTNFGVTTEGVNTGDYRLNVNFAVLPNGTWNNADGAWTDLAAWSGGFPVAAASIATFPDHGVLRTVTVPSNVSAGIINFEGGNYLINGTGQIVMANGTARPEIYVFGGDPVINAPIRMPSTGMNFQIPGGSSLTVNRLVDTTLDLVSVVNVLAGGSLKLTGLAELGMFNIDPGGFVDFTTTGGAILGLRDPSGTVTTSTYYPQLVGRILEWWNNGARDGRGIGTSATNPFTTIGFVPNIDESGRVIFETYLGVTIFNDEFIMRTTYLGDTNLDGVVNGVDLANLIEAYTIGGKTGWYNGDFNYDGVINEVDFGLFNAGFTGQGAPLGNGPIPVGGAVPEPASLALLAPAALALTRKRRTNR